MANELTVLILGAGASCPYGFPAGEELKNDLCDHLSGDLKRIPTGRWLLKFHSEKAVVSFGRKLRRSGQPSVDAFLEHRNDCAEIGKAAIAAILVPLENRDELDTNWYKRFFSGIVQKWDEFIQIGGWSVITYNYDRSLETFLFEAVKNTFNRSDERVAEEMKALPIIHLHGQLGYLPWQKKKSEVTRDYEKPQCAADIQIAAAGIKIPNEADAENDEAFKKAHSHIRAAKRIFFLGFGYHRENIARLRLPENLVKGAEVYGTTYHLSQVERNDLIKPIVDPLLSAGHSEKNFSFPVNREDILQFIRNNEHLSRVM